MQTHLDMLANTMNIAITSISEATTLFEDNADREFSPFESVLQFIHMIQSVHNYNVRTPRIDVQLY